MARSLHLVSSGNGYALIDRRPGPYSSSAPVDKQVLTLTADEIAQIGSDLKALNTSKNARAGESKPSNAKDATS